MNQEVSGSLWGLDHHSVHIAMRAALHCDRAPETRRNGLCWLISEVLVCSGLALLLCALSYRCAVVRTQNQQPDVQ